MRDHRETIGRELRSPRAPHPWEKTMIRRKIPSRVLWALAAMTVMAVMAKSGLAISAEGHNINVLANRPHLDGQWLGMHYASDGNCYFGSSDHCAHEGAAFLKYDPRSHEASVLCSDITTLTGDDPYYYPQGKLHSQLVEANGWLYWGTHWSNDQFPGGQTTYWKGTHFQAYCLATGEFRDYGIIADHYTTYAAVGVDPVRNYGYVFSCPIWGAGHIYRYDLTSGAKTDLYALPSGTAQVFHFFVDQRGDVWFSAGYDNGSMWVIRGATGTVERFNNALPPIYNWNSDTLQADQPGRFIMWMEPLADGDRAVFTEGYYGGRLYLFDSTKDVASGAAFSSAAWIGYTDLGLAVNGDKVIYYQRANNGYYHQEYKDFHLMSVDLNPAVTPQIQDYGLIVDQIGRIPWRLPAMMADGGGTIFMTGDWWTDWSRPGVDDGTYRYHYDKLTGLESYEKFPRGEEFGRADMPDVVTDNFNDNAMGSIWTLVEDDPGYVWLSESNQRLEVQSAPDSAAHTAAYQSHDWVFDPTRDFTCRVDYHIGSGSADADSIGLKIFKDNDTTSHVGIFATYDTLAGAKWIVKGATGGVDFESTPIDRDATDGAFYISCDAMTDKLYLSKTGYWRRPDEPNGDWMYSGLVSGEWSPHVIRVQLEGMAKNASFSGDTEYFDNFVADDAKLLTMRTLSVAGNPETNLAITLDTADALGDKDGATSFSRMFVQGTTVTLTAPATASHNAQTLNFLRWDVNNVPQTAGVLSTTVNLAEDTAAVAVYETAVWSLNIQSSPISGVAITSTPAGITPYSAQVDDAAAFTLNAPATVTKSGKTWYFVCWTLNGVAQTSGVLAAPVTVLGDVTAVATYRSVKSLTISGPSTIYGGTTAKYRCTAKFTAGSAKIVTTSARWTDSSPYLKFIKPGTLQASKVRSNIRAYITAKYGGVTKKFYVTIKHR